MLTAPDILISPITGDRNVWNRRRRIDITLPCSIVVNNVIRHSIGIHSVFGARNNHIYCVLLPREKEREIKLTLNKNIMISLSDVNSITNKIQKFHLSFPIWRMTSKWLFFLLLRNNIERSILFNLHRALKMHFPTSKKRFLASVRDMFQLMENQHHLQLMVNDGKSRRRDFLACTNIRWIARDTPRKKKFVLHSYIRIYIRR